MTDSFATYQINTCIVDIETRKATVYRTVGDKQTLIAFAIGRTTKDAVKQAVKHARMARRCNLW